MSHRDIKGTFHARMGMSTVRNRNSKDLTEIEEIKKFQEFTEDLFKNVSIIWIATMVWSLT